MKSLLFLAVASFLFTDPPASANILFSDLGTGADVYQSFTGWTVQGDGAPGDFNTENANLFTVAGTGSEQVGQIDLGVQYVSSVGKTFTVSIWTDVAGAPGSQVAGSGWTETANEAGADCCNLTTIANIGGLFLTGGSQYFLILAPVEITDDTDLSWQLNSMDVTGDVQYSHTGGAPWTDSGSGSTLAAFDIQGTPEPSSALLLGAGVSFFLLLKFRN